MYEEALDNVTIYIYTLGPSIQQAFGAYKINLEGYPQMQLMGHSPARGNPTAVTTWISEGFEHSFPDQPEAESSRGMLIGAMACRKLYQPTRARWHPHYSPTSPRYDRTPAYSPDPMGR